MVTSSPPLPSPALSLANEHAFIRYLIARGFGTLAVQMQTVAVGWQVYDITGDPLDLGLIGLSRSTSMVASDSSSAFTRWETAPLVMLRSAAARSKLCSSITVANVWS